MASNRRVARRQVDERMPPGYCKEVNGGLYDAPGRFPTVLGIDQSYTGFGVTAMALDGMPVYHSWCYKAHGSGITRLHAIDEFLYRILENLTDAGRPVHGSAMEGYAYGSQTANMAGELGSVVKMGLYKYFGTSAPRAAFPLIVPPMSLKKYAAGRGNGVKKQQMLLAIYKKWGVEFTDDNMADAYVLSQIARQFDTSAGLLAYELDVLAKLRDPKHREDPV